MTMVSRSTPKPPKPSSWPKTMRIVATYRHLGWTLAASVALGVFGGQWLDANLGPFEPQASWDGARI